MRARRSIFAAAAMVVAAVAALAAVAAAGGERVRPGVGIDRCDTAADCVETLTDPEDCCPSCSSRVVTRKRAAEMARRCGGDRPSRRCRTLACGRPRPAKPTCVSEQCADLNQL